MEKLALLDDEDEAGCWLLAGGGTGWLLCGGMPGFKPVPGPKIVPGASASGGNGAGVGEATAPAAGEGVP